MRSGLRCDGLDGERFTFAGGSGSEIVRNRTKLEAAVGGKRSFVAASPEVRIGNGADVRKRSHLDAFDAKAKRHPFAERRFAFRRRIAHTGELEDVLTSLMLPINYVDFIENPASAKFARDLGKKLSRWATEKCGIFWIVRSAKIACNSIAIGLIGEASSDTLKGQPCESDAASMCAFKRGELCHTASTTGRSPRF